jgi:hypothetical protein
MQPARRVSHHNAAFLLRVFISKRCAKPEIFQLKPRGVNFFRLNPMQEARKIRAAQQILSGLIRGHARGFGNFRAGA